MIKTDRLLPLFEKLISMDSPSFQERRIGDFVKKQLFQLGISVSEDAAAEKIGGSCGNLHAYLPGSLDLPPLLFCAHLDTVEPSRGKRIKTEKDGRITSAGETILGADDCAGIVSILEALRALKDTDLPHRPIELLFTVAEEPYCSGAKALDFSEIHSKEAYIFDLSGPVGDAAYQAPAILSFTAAFIGRCAHAGFSPESGIHAICAAACAIDAIPCGRIGSATLNFGTVTGGIADNIVPDSCILTGEIRSYSDREALQLLSDITQKMHTAADRYGAKVKIEHTLNLSAYRIDPESNTAKRFIAACGSQGLTARLCQTFGGSDNNILTQHGISGLVVATAMNLCHSCEEYTTATELEHSAKLALALMLSKE